jgi:peptidyl-prolyl cis-trans isomerase A (cyclophilin A)
VVERVSLYDNGPKEDFIMQDWAISGGTMSAGRGGLRFDAFTALGLLIVVWLGVTAWLLFRPAKGLAPFPEDPAPVAAGAAAAPPQDQQAQPAVEPKPITQEEAKAVTKSLSEQPGNPIVRIETTQGTILARLYLDLAPKTAENFIDLVNKEFYDGIVFHRVIKDFMIQTGDPTGTGRGGREDKGLPTKKLLDEFHEKLRHTGPGILSMANAGPNTGDSQFFITTVATPWLDGKHAIFGEVIKGLDVVQAIENAPTGRQDRPLQEVKMTRVRMVDPKEAEAAAK